MGQRLSYLGQIKIGCVKQRQEFPNSGFFRIHRFALPFHCTNRPNASGVPFAKFRQASTRSEEHTSELQSLMRISYAVFCLKKQTNNNCTCTTTKQQSLVQH